MVTVKMLGDSYEKKQDMMNLLNYIADTAEVVSGYGISLCSIDTIYCEFEAIKRHWKKAEEGRRQVRHLIVSFEDKEMSLDLVKKIAWKIGGLYGNRFQVFFGIHTDTAHPHVHFAINTVSYIDGRMFSENYSDFLNLIDNIKTICTFMMN